MGVLSENIDTYLALPPSPEKAARCRTEHRERWRRIDPSHLRAGDPVVWYCWECDAMYRVDISGWRRREPTQGVRDRIYQGD